MVVTASAVVVGALATALVPSASAVSAVLPTPASAAGPSRGPAGFLATNWTPTAPPQNVTDVAKTIGAVPTTGMDGTGIGIALVDTGVVAVPGLPRTQIVNGPDLSFESQGTTLDYLDTFGHGTHMAGIMIGNDSTTGLTGIAPKAKLTSIKVGTATGSVDPSQILAAIDWVVAHRNDDPYYPIRVLNLSYGTDSTQPTGMDPLNYAVEMAWKAGIVVVVAGGNAGNAATSLSDPAYDPFVLTVGSSAGKGTLTQTDDGVSPFTSAATTRKLDLLAPGESIVSLRNPGSYIDTTYATARVGTRMFKGSGSSQATAVVSAAVALLRQKRPTLTPDQVKAVLKASAVPVVGTVGVAQGLKEINLTRALAQAVPTNATQTYPYAYGSGSLEMARGGDHVNHDSSPLYGEYSIFGPFNASIWVYNVQLHGSGWVGGQWNSNTFAGGGWTGTSWAPKTWGAVTWSGGPWGAINWVDSTWSGHYWTGSAWSSTTAWTGHYWTGHYWTGDTWTSVGWK